MPKGTGESPQLPLAVAYAAWLITLLVLYPSCGWYAHLKATKKYVWLRYL